MLHHVILATLFHLSWSSHVTHYSVTMTTALVVSTCSALKCQQCLEYAGPKISKKRKESLLSCEKEVMSTCKEEETVCYDVRVTYTGKRGNSTVLQMGCGKEHMSCAAYKKEARFAECTLSKCSATDENEMCETEMLVRSSAEVPTMVTLLLLAGLLTCFAR